MKSGYRKFGGKRYTIYRFARTKPDAQYLAKGLRREGYLARVVRVPSLSVFRAGLGYEIYTLPSVWKKHTKGK